MAEQAADLCGLLRRGPSGCLQLRVAGEAASEALCAARQQRRLLPSLPLSLQVSGHLLLKTGIWAIHTPALIGRDCSACRP